MDLRLTFNEDVVNYDTWRPRYCKELFEDIISYSNLNSEKQAVEIGCGTGQATDSILKSGCSVTAVELGANFVQFTNEKYKGLKTFNAVNTDFESFQCEPGSVDLIYSATAFHWIPDEIGYKKAFDLLKPGGTIALFWNKPFASREDDPLHQEIQSIYKKYAMAVLGQPYKKIIEFDKERFDGINEHIVKNGFVNLQCKMYKNERTFNAQDYISLLNTYSNHRAMDPKVRVEFENEMISAINRFGGILRVYDTMDLHMAQKR